MDIPIAGVLPLEEVEVINMTNSIHSCGHCQKLIINFRESTTLGGVADCIQVDRPSIMSALAGGCLLFQHMNRMLSQHLNTAGVRGRHSKPNPSGTSQNTHSQFVLTLEFTSKRNRAGDLYWATVHWHFPGEPPQLDNEAGGLAVSAFSSEPVASFVTTRPILPRVTVDGVCGLAKTWLNDCHSGHQNCPKHQTTFMPTRLIDLRSLENGCARLHAPTPADVTKYAAKYAALSYCWGPYNHMTTTKASLSDRINAIHIHSLPQSIQDAISVTRGLDIWFLWVDCLCIVQDDGEEVSREIAGMPDVYMGAYVTITASCATGSHEVFYRCRPPAEDPLQFRIPYQISGKQGAVILTTEIAPYHVEEPLSTRGWALQERLLSPRVLEFASRQLRSLCHSRIYSDAGMMYDDPLQQVAPLPIRSPAPPRRYPGDGPLAHCGFPEWDHIVWKYTSRSLTMPKDRLLAISGIAKVYSEVLRSDYLAGLWRVDLLHDLAWMMCQVPNKQPLQKRAPSWSWAAIDGMIVSGPLSRPRAQYAAEVVECECLPVSSSAPFGAVINGGFLKIPSFVRRVSKPILLHNSLVRIWFDTVESSRWSIQKQWFLLLYPHLRLGDGDTPAERAVEMYGLVLAEQGQDFERVGFFSLYLSFVPDENLQRFYGLEHWEYRTLTIL
ncbi:HET-domain-containing protein [Canariomyces notabilis]|uniref:HET-domain-containing protein n=1 Tax=Canariomyces notabilis TaxID=2074819 RepID=A0AAN6QBD7_9PEZI|nr:HET-domain-containing protein [Canariomyces arenarius]